ncbi:hypothetical protein [Methylophilus sp. TWE2]|uniref:hypothetical protein n=1 Tax=Methylophilus sp. TWE2 TaxID=1662285 RepID=UPI00067098A8|nr:hypothetical protein [Methylophilus sp. TWE2]AKR43179.1 hypothetical protein ACJ67_06880 [Methylophilus sp. TWE2]
MKHWQRIAFGIFTIVGSTVGFISGVSGLFSGSNLIEWLMLIAATVVYAWGIWCGIGLLQAEVGAERANLKFWLVQVPSFGSPLISYFLSCGFHTTVSLQLFPIKLSAKILVGSYFSYGLLQPNQPFIIGINLFAMFIVWWLSKSVVQLSPNFAVNKDAPTATLPGRPLP